MLYCWYAPSESFFFGLVLYDPACNGGGVHSQAGKRHVNL